MTICLIASTLVILSATTCICGWIHRTRGRDSRAWAQELLENGLVQKPPIVAHACCICGEEIGCDDKVDYCRDSICHAVCYAAQETP